LMNRRRLVAWLGLAPIATVPTFKALAGDAVIDPAIDEDFWNLVKDCYVAPVGQIVPVAERSMVIGEGKPLFTTCYKIFDGARWLDCTSDEGTALMRAGRSISTSIRPALHRKTLPR
jgi:hypothetical protein